MNISSAHNKTVLSIAELCFAYANIDADDQMVINRLSLQIKEGEMVCILGVSGCGKTTLLNLIAGLLKPHSGNIQLMDSTEEGKRIGYIFQKDALLPWRTVESNLMLATQISKNISRQSAHERINHYLGTFHLNEQILNKHPSQLSGGMRQRVSIIQSLMFNPQLLLLDEPFSALDFYTKLQLESEFCQLVKEKKKAAILVTHDIDEAIAMADRVLIMSKDGELIKEFHVDLGGGDRSPESARGTPQFANLYREIWSQLKTAITA